MRIALVALLACAAAAFAQQPPPPDLEAMAKNVKAHPEDRAALKDYLLVAVNELKRKVNAHDDDGAIDLANRIDDVKTGLSTVYYARGLAYYHKKQLDQALTDLRNARSAADAAGKPRPEIDISITNACYGKGDMEGTLAALNDYRGHGGQLDPAWYLLHLEALERTRQIDKLLELLKEAMEKFPADPSIQKWYAKYQTTLKASAKEADMAQGGTLHFAIRFQTNQEDPTAKDRVARGLEAAYDKVTRDLGQVPSKVVSVIIYADRQTYEETGDVPHWVGAHYDPRDGSIRVGLTDARMSEAEFDGYLVHEFTHLVLDEITQHNIPSWLTEGIAQIEQDRDTSRADNKLRAALRHPDRLPKIQALEGSINAGGAVDVGLGYAIGWSFAKYLTDQWGSSSMSSVLVKLGQRYTFEQAAASDYDTLMKQWVAAEKSRLNVP